MARERVDRALQPDQAQGVPGARAAGREHVLPGGRALRSLVRVAADRDDFVALVRQSLRDGGAGTPARRRAAVAGASWDAGRGVPAAHLRRRPGHEADVRLRRDPSVRRRSRWTWRSLRAMAASWRTADRTARGSWSRGAWARPTGASPSSTRTAPPQPMASPDGRLHVCFNGEIFNYRELRGDARLPVPDRRRHGGRCLPASAARAGRGEELRGQFAYASARSRRRVLWLVRDRLGILPLYLRADGAAHRLRVRGQGPAGLLPGGPRVDEDSLDAYLGDGPCPRPPPCSAAWSKLPPGHWLRIGADGRHDHRRYWALPEAATTVDR